MLLLFIMRNIGSGKKNLFRLVSLVVNVEIVLYCIRQRSQCQKIFLRIVAYTKDRVERTKKRFYFMSIVHFPFTAHHQWADQFHEIGSQSVEDDSFFHYHIVFPDSMLQHMCQFVTLFFHFPKFSFELLAVESQLLCRLCQQNGVQFFFIGFIFIVNNRPMAVNLTFSIKTKPRRTNPPGLVFVCFCSSQRSNRRTLFHYFSINIDRLFALTGYLVLL